MESMGGGIFVYEALKAAAGMINEAQSQTKHIVLFADAADSEQPGDYINLLNACRESGITVSVIGLGSRSDVDASFLIDVARIGGGEIYFTDKASELPRLFAQDTFIVARSSFIEDETELRTTALMRSFFNMEFNFDSTIGGYNLCYLRDGASCGIFSVDEYDAPVMAGWRAGIGRVLCYMPEVNGEYTGQISNWDRIGSFYSSMVKWTANRGLELGGGMMLEQKVRDGVCRIMLHLDPGRDSESFNELPKVTTILSKEGSPPESKVSTMRYSGADTLILEQPLSGDLTYLSTVEIEGADTVTLPAVCLPYSAEFKAGQSGRGVESLQDVARITGGRERVNVSQVWKDIAKKPQMVSLSKWLLLTAVVLLLLEVLERRTGVISRRNFKWAKAEIKFFEALKPKFNKQKRRPAKVVKTKETKQEEEKKPKKKKKEEETAGLLSAMNKAQKKAKSRTDRK